jgi:hypothetical protein
MIVCAGPIETEYQNHHKAQKIRDSDLRCHAKTPLLKGDPATFNLNPDFGSIDVL